VIKETLGYLRGRDRASIVAMLKEGIREGGLDPADVPVYESEMLALEAELAESVSTDDGPTRAAGAGTPRGGRVVVVFCHEQRNEVFALLDRLGARQVDAATVQGGRVPSRPGRAYG
jgi:hypothetical protein